MKLTFLGTGTSTGVPQIGCTCPVCTSTDARDKRLRCSSLITTDEGQRLLIDCSPDFRQQMLNVGLNRIDAILITHEHYDHVGGIDDLRPSNLFDHVSVYAEPLCASHLEERLPYIFKTPFYPGVPTPHLERFPFGETREIAGIRVKALEVIHGKLPISGYLFERLAYITDASHLSEETLNQIKGIDTLVINTLRQRPHASHFSIAETLDVIAKTQPRRAFLIHMSHTAGFHNELQVSLPPNVIVAHDGLEIEV